MKAKTLSLRKPMLDLLAGFSGREEGLRAVKRYMMYVPMHYRTEVWGHAKRLAWLVEEVGLSVKKIMPSFDLAKAMLIALVHDDAEMIIGDIQAGNKAKMSAAELAQLEKNERDAIEKLSQRFPEKVGSYIYKDLLYAGLDLNCPEARLVKFFDKFDAFGEALHEIYSGNSRFVTNATTEYGLIPLPTDYYIGWLNGFPAKYPEFNRLWLGEYPFLINITPADFKAVAAQGAPHTEESLKQPTGYAPYDFWRRVLLARADQETLDNLVLVKER
jgi:5'-deoxynucleotidase YfbR-like HD superfamily hydrolase